MADILIRGMEMPENCTECPCFSQWDDCGINHEWKFADEFDKTKDRLPSCPLLHLPEGHGRLGDLDALLESMRESYQKAQEWRDNSSGGIYDRADATVMAFLEFGNRTKNAPTIVPADVTDIDVGNKSEGGIKI